MFFFHLNLELTYSAHRYLLFRVSGSNLPPSTFPFSFLFLLIPRFSLLLPQVTYLLNFIPTFCPTPTPCIDPPTSPPILYPLTLRSSFLFPYPPPSSPWPFFHFSTSGFAPDTSK